MDMAGLDDFVRGYVEAATWTDLIVDGQEETGSEPHQYGPSDLAGASYTAVLIECLNFVEANEADLDEYCEHVEIVDGDSPEAYAGHDFYLTRAGHGVGYWDRRMGELGERLTEAVKRTGYVENPYLRADGWIEFHT